MCKQVKSKKGLEDNDSRMFGVYDRNGNICSIHKTQQTATRVKNKMVQYTEDTAYFVDFVIVT
jgi:hypothetical protein